MIKIKTTNLLTNFNIDGNNCIYTNEIPCIIDFHATWCKPCKTVEKTLNILEKENPTIIFYSVDIEEEYELAEIFNIKNLPTIILCSIDDTVKLMGNIGETKIQEELYKISNILV